MSRSNSLRFGGFAVLIILLAVFALGCGGTPSAEKTEVKDTPKEEVKNVTKEVMEEVQMYVCPMHPEITSTDPAVKCSICGMALVPKEDIEMDTTIYACPMHPEEHSTDPEAKCGICGMALEEMKKESGEEPGHEGHGH